MANSDKNILVTPSVGLSANPTIKFNGANNTPTTLRVLDDGTVSFEGTAGQLFSISDGLSGSIFSVNDISGIPSMEVLDTGLVKINQYGGSTVFGTSAALQNASSVNAKVSILTGSAATPGLIIKAVSSQSANLLEWKDSSNGNMAFIDAVGSATFNNLGTTNNIYAYYGKISANAQAAGHLGQMTAIATSASTIGMVIRGAASQTADLQQWQNSAGTVLAFINSAGTAKLPIITDVASTGSLIYMNASNVEINTRSVGNIGLIVSGVASQSANLQEWRNSAGTVLAYVISDGSFVTRGALIGGQYSGTAIFGVQGYSASNVVAIVKGVASQTANLQEWQNSSGTVIARVDKDGNNYSNAFVTPGFEFYSAPENSGGFVYLKKETAAAANPGSGAAKIYFRDGTTAGTLKLVVRAGTAGAETTILDNIPQS